MSVVEEFNEEISKSAENFVYNVFPLKAKEMDALLHQDEFLLTNLPRLKRISEASISLPLKLKDSKTADTSLLPPKRKKMMKIKAQDVPECDVKIQKETVLSNQQITELIDVLRPELIELMEACNTMRVWVTLLLPKIEDGNNFGVSVQEEIMSEIKSVESETASFFEQITSYHLSRAKVSSKLVKHPSIGDYAKYVIEEDEKQFVNIRHVIAELRNFYTSLHDLIDKNIDKIKKPRNENHNQMY